MHAHQNESQNVIKRKDTVHKMVCYAQRSTKTEKVFLKRGKGNENDREQIVSSFAAGICTITKCFSIRTLQRKMPIDMNS